MVKVKTLDCGVRVAMEKVEHVQSAAIGFHIRAGAIDEVAKYSGISHFVEHMMFKGTENRSAMEIAEDIDKLGGQINAFTSNEMTCYYVKTLSSNLYKSADVLIDMLTNSLFDKHEMTRERQVVCEEIKMTNDSPDDAAQDAIMYLVNKGNPIGNSILGTPTSLRNVSRNVIVDYVANEYTRDSIVVAIAGNFDEDEFCNYLEGKLSSLKATKEEKQHIITPYEPAYKDMVRDIEQAHLFIGKDGCTLNDDDRYAQMVFSKILGGSMSSRLFQNVREKKGLAYSVYSANAFNTLAGGFYIYAGISHENIRNALEAIKDELVLIGDKGVSEEEVSKAKEQIKSGFIFGLENIASKMFSIGKAILLNGSVKKEEEVLEMIDNITVDDVNLMAKNFANPTEYCGVVNSNKKFNIKGALQG